MNNAAVGVYVGEALARYGFGRGHPFGSDRLGAFWTYAREQGLDQQVTVCEPAAATREEIERFHTPGYVDRVIRQSATGAGYLDYGDTPAFPGVYEAAAVVAGTSAEAARRIMAGEHKRAFVPIAGLHHARRNSAGGFCVFNDCGIVIETLRAEFGLQRIAYVDIDAHHGDGVFYGFERDPAVIFADVHEDGRFLYPGTGMASERGLGEAAGTKLNVPMPPGADDALFMEAWETVEQHLDAFACEFIILQCGADGLAGDPITHLQYTTAVHTHAAERLCTLADQHCAGRLLALGGGGYKRDNLVHAWTAVLQALVASQHSPTNG